jgi:hypothetical protein
MAVVAFCSAKHSPGVSVTALACALTWTRPVILAECDPAGGDIAAGYLREVRLDGLGLGRLTASLHRRRLAEDLWAQLVDLAPGKDTAMKRLVLPGLPDPALAARWAERSTPSEPAGWEQLAQLFRSLEAGDGGFDVIADCGRLAAQDPPTPIVAAADVVLLVLRPTLPAARAAAVALPILRAFSSAGVGLVTVGDGVYGGKELALELRTPVVAAMPDDPGTAAVLSSGGERHRARLLRAAARAEAQVWQLIDAGRATRIGPRPAAAPNVASEVPSVH